MILQQDIGNLDFKVLCLRACVCCIMYNNSIQLLCRKEKKKTPLFIKTEERDDFKTPSGFYLELGFYL